jgi:hypothetical protein
VEGGGRGWSWVVARTPSYAGDALIRQRFVLAATSAPGSEHRGALLRVDLAGREQLGGHRRDESEAGHRLDEMSAGSLAAFTSPIS